MFWSIKITIKTFAITRHKLSKIHSSVATEADRLDSPKPETGNLPKSCLSFYSLQLRPNILHNQLINNVRN